MLRLWKTSLGLLLIAGLCGMASSSECLCSVENVKSRSTVLAVGSEAVYPFSTDIAEYLGASTVYAIPMVVKMATTAGVDNFIHNDSIDILNASRRITPAEYNEAVSNGTGPLMEIGFGYDGIVFARYKNDKSFSLSLEDIFLAMAKEIPEDGRLVINHYTKWNQINPSLPEADICIYGPGEGSGTVSTLKSLVMDAVSRKHSEYNGAYREIRRDGVYHVYTENEPKIIHEIMNKRSSIGIINYSFLKNGHQYISGIQVNGIAADAQTIALGTYPLSRELYMYLKVDHLKLIPGLKEYFELLLSEKSIGEKGALAGLGLINVSPEKYQKLLEKWNNIEVLGEDDL